MNKAYEIFSRFYDDYIKDTAPELHNDYYKLIKLIENKFKLEINSILDITCGTGILMKLLVESGYTNVEGIDNSSEMLKQAISKGLMVSKFDVRDFHLGKKYDLIVSFDSIGHILDDKDLSKVLIRVASHLNDGGIFICDGGTKAKANRMIGQTFNYDSEAYSFMWDNEGHGSSVNVALNIVEKATGHIFTERFGLQGHDIEDIVTAARDTDLMLIFATMEPLVKKNGSFIVCFQKCNT